MASHDLKLSSGGVAVLKEILPSQGWYAEKPIPVALAAAQVNERISDLKVPKTEDEDPTWAEREYALTVSETERSGVKECLKFYMSKGALRLTSHVIKLLVSFGLDEA